MKAPTLPPRQVPTAALRHAQRAWKLLHVDSAQARAGAERAITAAGDSDALAEGWGRLALGFHLLYYGTAAEAARELRRAQASFERASDRTGHLLASAGIARAMWRQGRAQEALQTVLPLRDEGVRVLRHEQRGVLLNAIAGCYSAQGDSAQAFAYMFEALRDAGPRSGHGFDIVLHCNLSHELLQIGDYVHALQYVEQGLARIGAVKNARLQSVLWINRVTCLTELGRAAECLADVAALLALPADPSGRGRMAAHYETLAIAALRAGETTLGADLVQRAWALGDTLLPDERLERDTATGLLALVRGEPAGAVEALLPSVAAALSDTSEGLSVRMRAQYFNILSEAHEAAGQPAAALAALRQGQRLHRAQAVMLASRARYQAALLQTELLRLQHQLDERRRPPARDRARARRAGGHQRAADPQGRRRSQRCSRRCSSRPRAISLTGLFNRRHLNDTLPAMLALAERESQPMAVAIIDLDHFKRVNDEHGHAAGDRLLAAFGELLARHCRRSDVACRYGGEEFCLLMPRTDAPGASRKVQSLLRRWRAQAFDLAGTTLAGLSFSAGVADTSVAPASPDALLKAADDQLLATKRGGRNRVGIAASEPAALVPR
jgi:diguanylate cyclase (GGDEF)-like protein